MKQSDHSRSQWYAWFKEGAQERKPRQPVVIPRQTAEAAVKVIMEYPYFSAVKGQAYMIYHRLGFMPHHFYKTLKHVSRRIVFQEVEKRQLLPARGSYEHVKPQAVGEVWAEDFTELRIYGHKFYAALVIDVCSSFYLGAASSDRAGGKLVDAPLEQAVSQNNGQGPREFLLSDNGKQYIDSAHEKHLDALEIVHKRIPACKPQYNGSVECGVKEFKNLFYTIWAVRESAGTDKGKKLDQRVENAVQECRSRLNHLIPRPCLGGVTPADLHNGTALKKKQENQQWCNEEKARAAKNAKPWEMTIWNLVRSVLFQKQLSHLQILTMFCFFLKRPLRKLANLVHGVLGEYSQLSSDFP